MATAENEDRPPVAPSEGQHEQIQQSKPPNGSYELVLQPSRVEARSSSPVLRPPTSPSTTRQDAIPSVEAGKLTATPEPESKSGTLTAPSEIAIDHAATLQLPAPPQDSESNQEEEGEAQPPLDINHALQYLDAVKTQFELKPIIYARFLDTMKEFKSQLIDTPVVIARVTELFRGHPRLIEGFNTFLPAGYKIECGRDSEQQEMITVTTPTGKVLHGTTGASALGLSPGPAYLPQVNRTPEPAVLLPPPPTLNHGPPTPMQGVEPTDAERPINHAIDFVNRIKRRYADEPEVYRSFLDVLQAYQRGGEVESAVVHKEVTALFQHRSPDLLEEFRMFLPDQSGLLGLAEVGGPGKDKKLKAPGAESSKRKRKALDRDTRDREIASKNFSVGKSKKPKHRHADQLSPATQPRTYMQTDEYIFFDRVRRYLDNREVYDEFLRLINLFTQGFINGRTLLLRAEDFLGDSEHMMKFRDIVGIEPQDPIPEPVPNVTRLRWDHNMKAIVDMGYKSAYKKLSPSAELASCSGRDSLCNSVLNDEYILSPDINPDDGGYVSHKKNIYEEALHRTEEERHEYDFHLEAISRTIAILEPINNKIAQIPTVEERNAFRLKPNLGGVLKSIHQRVLKKIYGREAGMEVVAAMQDIPAVAIPVVLQRLRQKEEEWRRAQREWNKIWREVDKRNYYKSLDHQGITFKAQDKKMTGARFFISEIEAARDQERFKRASFIDPSFKKTRPTHHLEVIVGNMAVLCDTLKLCLSYFDRVRNQYHQAEQEKMEYFLRTALPTLLDFDPSTVDPNNNANGVESAPAASNGLYEKDLRKRLLKNEQAKSSSRPTRDGARSSRSTSRHQSPARVNEPLGDEPLLVSARPSKVASDGRETVFFADSNFYVCFRQLMALYSRLNACNDLASVTASQLANETFESPPGIAKPQNLLDEANPAAHFYEHLLHSFEQLFDNEIEQSTFEDILRYMFGIKAYHLFTADKLIAAVLKQIQLLVSDGKSLELWVLFLKDLENPNNESTESRERYRLDSERFVNNEENAYRINWTVGDSRLRFTLLGEGEPEGEDTEMLNELWRAYLDSYTTNDQTDGVSRSALKRSFLKRNLPSHSLQTELLTKFSGMSALEIRICTRTYRIFYVPGTSDALHVRNKTGDVEKAQERFAKRQAKQQSWLDVRISNAGVLSQKLRDAQRNDDH